MLKARRRKERISCASHWSVSWCCLTQPKQSSVRLRRYAKHPDWSVRLYLLPVWRLHGNPLWRCHLVSVRRSQHERILSRREVAGERHTVPTALLQETQCSYILIIVLYKGSTGLCQTVQNTDLAFRQKCLLSFAFTVNRIRVTNKCLLVWTERTPGTQVLKGFIHPLSLWLIII